MTKVLFELGLVAVKQIDGKKVCLGSPNWAVTRNAARLLMKLTKQEATVESLAREYLLGEGFGSIFSEAVT